MDKNLAGIIGAVGVLAASLPAQATTAQPSAAEAMHAASYADLLKPIPNAVEILNASAAIPDPTAPSAGETEKARLILRIGWRHHHHHHHHHWWRHHHHHHHHFS